jgi:hypothetical protein
MRAVDTRYVHASRMQARKRYLITRLRADRADRLKRDLPRGIEILLDLPGNKIRTDNIDEPILLTAGQEFVLKPENLTYRPFYKSLNKGDMISAADGTIRLEVTAVEGEDVKTKLGTRKGVNVRGVHGNIPFDFERDIALLNIAIETKIDYVGISFVRKVEHVRRLRAQLARTGIKTLAKIETSEALEHVDLILAEADLIMIDRGDLEADIGREKRALDAEAGAPARSSDGGARRYRVAVPDLDDDKASAVHGRGVRCRQRGSRRCLDAHAFRGDRGRGLSVRLHRYDEERRRRD